MVEFEHVVEMEKALLMPEVRRDREKLEAWIADDFREVGAYKGVFGKSEVLAELPVENDVLFTSDAFEAKMLGEGVIMVNFIVTKHIQEQKLRSFRTSIWVKRDCWQMVFHQGTALK
ncbi:MAG: DUF4440 domain-containing protein [Pseudomonas fluorescens]|nr:MAG: DUF4440 domain-containing protein [Pseudomonas fluorescens]